ncbi:hypothetical protein LTR10_023609 [Elasticomyces elasticus]|uniref:Uncharacterized protein n=1 Tax=Exophiala sideris TaxID=1016849 RepID=A0ABR0J8X9_9EURO|nr:hypothetical protein LTR10_023609 [Elasticomyces elasticus]KAK5025459.1 hypothetical protein LTR13_010423 [Exophiala sideris]KAK5029731.1 hypothetical protein LTS07_005455 [Exophiala sideris]KAK5058507.1 hypothetical protein LTR69_006912 [Exophiala sideris]KAK5178520.1 hypothetical protein LTR44_008891 [Eurotiomycetes sp. CCFEE 6388]
MATRIITFVTGGNGGIGYEAVKALLQSSKPYHILMGSRSLNNAKTAIETLKKECPEATNIVEPVQLDLTSDESIQKAYEHVAADHGRLDVLVNNAGASFDIEYVKGNVSLRDSFNKAYDVNVAGTNVMTWTFVPLLFKSADPRLLFVTGLSGINQASQKYWPTPPQPAGWPKEISFETIGYRCTKCALNMLMLDYNHKLKADGVKVWAIAPGMLATNLGGLGPVEIAKLGAKPAHLGGEFIRDVVEGVRDADVGKAVSKDGFMDW